MATDSQETTQLIKRECPSLRHVPASDISFLTCFDRDTAKANGVLFRLSSAVDLWDVGDEKTLPITYIHAMSQSPQSLQLYAQAMRAKVDAKQSGGKVPTISVRAKGGNAGAVKKARYPDCRISLDALSWQDFVNQVGSPGIQGATNIGHGWVDLVSGKEQWDLGRATLEV